MSKKLSLIISLLILFSACSSLTQKRDVLTGNVFHSTLPNIKIKFDDTFVYKGTKTKTHQSGAREQDMILSDEVQEHYIWHNSSNEAAAIVSIKKLRGDWSWYPPEEKEPCKKGYLYSNSPKIVDKW